MPQNGALLDRIFSELNALEPKRIKRVAETPLASGKPSKTQVHFR